MSVQAQPARQDNGVVWETGQPLSPAILGNKTSLSVAGRQALGGLMGRQPGLFLWQLFLTWSTIAAAIWAAGYFQTVSISVLVVVFIATRQNVLALLMHEQAHRLAFRSRWGDLLCNLTIAYPLLVTLEGYRRVHLAHHRHYFTDKDPDYVRKQGKGWTFPQRAGYLLKLLLVEASGIHTWQLLKSKNLKTASSRVRIASYVPWIRAVFYLALVAVLIGTRTWDLFLLYWLLPLVTVFQAIVRWAAICEHKYNLIRPTVAESTPFIELRWWESLLLPDLNFHTFHIYHHWYPAIPYRRLKCVHEIFLRDGLVEERNIFKGYGRYLKYLTNPRSRAAIPEYSRTQAAPGSEGGTGSP